MLRDAQRIGELGDARGARPWVDAPELRVELEVRAAGEAAVHDGLLEDDAAHAAGVQRALDDVVAGEQRRCRSWARWSS